MARPKSDLNYAWLIFKRFLKREKFEQFALTSKLGVVVFHLIPVEGVVQTWLFESYGQVINRSGFESTRTSECEEHSDSFFRQLS